MFCRSILHYKDLDYFVEYTPLVVTYIVLVLYASYYATDKIFPRFSGLLSIAPVPVQQP